MSFSAFSILEAVQLLPVDLRMQRRTNTKVVKKEANVECKFTEMFKNSSVGDNF